VSQRGPSRVLGPDVPVSSPSLLSLTDEVRSEPSTYDVPWDRQVLPQERIARRIRRWL
jgi:hypothetical protein